MKLINKNGQKSYVIVYLSLLSGEYYKTPRTDLGFNLMLKFTTRMHFLAK